MQNKNHYQFVTFFHSCDQYSYRSKISCSSLTYFKFGELKLTFCALINSSYKVYFCCFLRMVTLQISDHDWSLVLKYWKDLQKHLNHPDDFKEHIHFLNRIIFQSHGQNTQIKTKNTIKTQKEKEKETKVDDLKEEEDDNDEVKIDSKLKTFIIEPV